MFEILVAVAFCWLFFKAVGLALKVTWGVAKVVACILFAAALPILIICIAFAGGAVLLLPVALVAASFGILRVCV